MDTEQLSPRQRIIELERGRPFREVFADLCEQGLSGEEIARDLGVNRFTVYRWLDALKAERRYYIPPAQ